MANNPPTPEKQQSLLDKDSENVRQESSDNENGDVQTSVLPNEGVQTEQEEMQLQPEQSQIPIESVTAKPGHSYEETRSETYGSYEQLSSSTKDGTESSYYSPPELSEELQTEQEKDKSQITIPPNPQHSSDEPEKESLTSAKQQSLLRKISAALITRIKERKHTLLEEPRIEIDPIQPVAGPSGTIPISKEPNIDSPIPSSSTATSPSTEPPRYPLSPDVEKRVPPAGHNPDSYSYTPSSSEWTAEHVRGQIGRTDSLFGFPSLPDIGSTTTLEVKRERVERRRAAGEYESWYEHRPGAPPTATDEDEDRRPYPDWIRWIEDRVEVD